MKKTRPNKLSELIHAAQRDNAHHSSARVSSRLVVLKCEAEQIDEEIIALSAAREKARERKKRVDAMIVGLNNVLNDRMILSVG